MPAENHPVPESRGNRVSQVTPASEYFSSPLLQWINLSLLLSLTSYESNKNLVCVRSGETCFFIQSILSPACFHSQSFSSCGRAEVSRPRYPGSLGVEASSTLSPCHLLVHDPGASSFPRKPRPPLKFGDETNGWPQELGRKPGRTARVHSCKCPGSSQ